MIYKNDNRRKSTGNAEEVGNCGNEIPTKCLEDQQAVARTLFTSQLFCIS